MSGQVNLRRIFNFILVRRPCSLRVTQCYFIDSLTRSILFPPNRNISTLSISNSTLTVVLSSTATALDGIICCTCLITQAKEEKLTDRLRDQMKQSQFDNITPRTRGRRGGIGLGGLYAYEMEDVVESKQRWQSSMPLSPASPSVWPSCLRASKCG